ncbi:shikimate kinase [Rhizobium sp. L1K21]|uniref:shikimate kinase n=1 Tax=Rhizobium sp. L1K21 TaxID=2954933 RepID=UPI00209401A8|nr:shikimate kinase [Rhizobium sp. L1K21]MCO6188143.1 shikimate kinase [Rhizobium sp. L1K21]
MAPVSQTEIARKTRELLGERNLVFVGLMGAGKTAIGKMVAAELGLPFVDSDKEIETVSRMSINDLFANYGEPEFRSLEARVICRLIDNGPRVVSTGGGAFINDETRKLVKEHNAISVWLDADLELLWTRVSKRSSRPLLKTENPKQTLKTLLETRYPIYALADVHVKSRDVKKEEVANDVMAAVVAYLEGVKEETVDAE